MGDAAYRFEIGTGISGGSRAFALWRPCEWAMATSSDDHCEEFVTAELNALLNRAESSEAALAEARKKLAELREAAERVCQDPDDVCDADWRDLRAALDASAPEGGE